MRVPQPPLPPLAWFQPSEGERQRRRKVFATLSLKLERLGLRLEHMHLRGDVTVSLDRTVWIAGGPLSQINRDLVRVPLSLLYALLDKQTGHFLNHHDDVQGFVTDPSNLETLFTVLEGRYKLTKRKLT